MTLRKKFHTGTYTTLSLMSVTDTQLKLGLRSEVKGEQTVLQVRELHTIVIKKCDLK